MFHTVLPFPPCFHHHTLCYALLSLFFFSHYTQETLDFHYGKHHQAYINNLNNALSSKPVSYSAGKLEDIITQEKEGTFVYNQAAQAWNHDFFWKCLTPGGNAASGPASGPIKDAIQKHFGSYDKFKAAMTQAVVGHFGSGWAWLVQV